MNKRLLTTIQIAFLCGVMLFPFIGEPFYTELLGKTLLMAIFAMSLDLLVGFTGLVSLGHSAYFGIAAYVVALMTPKYEAASFWLTFPVAVSASALVALVVGLLVLRTSGIYFIMVTLAFAQMAFYLFHDTELGGGSDGVYINFRPSTEIMGVKPFDLDNPTHVYYLIAVSMVVVYLFLSRILKSPLGKVIVGIKSNEHRMKSIGFQTFKYKLVAFTMAGAVAGVAGYLYAVMYGFVTPELLSWHQSANVLLMVIIGGMGNLLTAIVGAFLFITLQELFSSMTQHWHLMLGISVVAIVMYLPGGLSALPRRLKDAVSGEDEK